MKHFFLSAVLCLITFQAFSQNIFFVRASVNPLVKPIGETGFKEFGLGFYDFNYEEKTMQEYAFLFGKKLAKNKLSNLHFAFFLFIFTLTSIKIISMFAQYVHISLTVLLSTYLCAYEK